MKMCESNSQMTCYGRSHLFSKVPRRTTNQPIHNLCGNCLTFAFQFSFYRKYTKTLFGGYRSMSTKMANSLNGAWLQGIMVVVFIILEWKTITTILCKCVSLTELAIACGEIRHKETRRRPGGLFATRMPRTQRRQESTDVNQWFIAMNLYIIFFRVVYVGKVEKNQTHKHVNDDVMATVAFILLRIDCEIINLLLSVFWF